MTLRINGEERLLPTLATVSDLVKHLALPAATLLIEHNGIALRRAEWEGALLRDGDGIELLRIAAGG
jgi:thiamine biosynthesis protein ThiS